MKTLDFTFWLPARGFVALLRGKRGNLFKQAHGSDSDT